MLKSFRLARYRFHLLPKEPIFLPAYNKGNTLRGAFVRPREITAANKEVATKLGELERKVASHDEAVRSLVTAVRRLMESPSSAPRRRIGFRVEEACLCGHADRRGRSIGGGGCVARRGGDGG